MKLIERDECMAMLIGLLIGAAGGAFIGIVIMSLCIISARDNRKEEQAETMSDVISTD